MRISTNTIDFQKFIFATGFALMLCGQISVCQATPLTLAPGTSISATSEAYPAGATLLSSTSQNFSSASLSGVLISSVYSGDTGNEYGLADLTFTYEILLSASSSDAASSINIGNFSGFNTDVSYNPSNGGAAPTTVSRDPNGNQIVFVFGGYVLPGFDSALLVIQTDATTFTSGSASVTDDVGTPAIPNFSPVPDVTGMGSFLLALGLLAGFGRLSKVAFNF